MPSRIWNKKDSFRFVKIRAVIDAVGTQSKAIQVNKFLTVRHKLQVQAQSYKFLKSVKFLTVVSYCEAIILDSFSYEA